MPITIPADTHVPGDPGHTTDHNNIADVLTAVCPPYQFWAQKYGALGNGFVIENDVNITTGTNALSTTTSAPFTAGDVGKKIVINYAGSSATVPLSTTISGFTDSKHVTLAANAGTTVTLGDAMYGSDDTAAINAAITAAVSYAAAPTGFNYCEVVFNQGIFVIAGALTQGGATAGNAQIPLPVISGTTSQKITLCLRGTAIDASPFPYWNQSIPQAPAGTILFTTLMGQTFSGTFDSPSVVGGPTPAQGYGTTPSLLFSNMLVVIDQLTVMAPANPSLIGWDFRGVAECNAPSISSTAFMTPSEMTSTKPADSGGVGLYMPARGNNDNCNVGLYGCEGFYYGLAVSEHFTAQRISCVYCTVGLYIATPGNVVHGASILYCSIEQTATVVQLTQGSATFPIFIARLETELFTTLIDDNSGLYGLIRWGGLSGDTIVVNTAPNLELINDNRARGHATAPGVPATTVALVNPFWRHAAVNVVPGASTCAIAVDGTATGIVLASSGVGGTVIVPSGKTITLTYTSAPTWNWVLM